MNKKDTPTLLSNTFDNRFNIENYTQFIRELLKDKLIIQNKQFNVQKEFSDQIKSFIKIGEYKTGRNNIEVLVAETNSLDRARTAQRNFIAKWLNNSMFPKDAALVAFYDPKREDWRFSFVKMEYKFDEKGKPVQEITPAKRYSFLVGKNEPNHTCKKIFLDLITDNEKQLTLEDIENSFSVDNVTKEFFEEYKNRFFELKAELDKIINQNKIVATEFEAKGINSTEFAKKLLGQIVFLYFLQKKGWLGIKKSDNGFDEWGAGPKDFMRRLFDKKLVNYDNFFKDALAPLFYQALANDRRADSDYYEKLKCKIPFLNGGLFEPINSYLWETIDLKIDNDIFKDIFTTFDRFNFTIKEDEPLEKEVAVDPEMLGKVFENLLDVTDRKSKGAFYTPREIVHYMCQQSLINYLETNSKDLKVKKEEIELFIQQGDIALNQVKRIVELNKSHRLDLLKEGDDKFILPASIRQKYKEIDNLLFNIKICDPAVGSGAFPVGMMNEIIKARNILTYFFNEKEQKERTDYYLKRQTIENSLYGVDIEPSAVEITKLRFWLSLIVDETDMKNINPLPNLDNKIMCGNSLLEEYKGIKLFDKSLVLKGTSSGRQMTLVKKESDYKFELLQQLQNELFNEQDRNKKKGLMKKIEDIEWEFIEQSLKEQKKENEIKELEKFKSSKAKPFFLWELYFSDVFRRENPGFDVVIGNPPYVSAWNINNTEKEYYLRAYASAIGHYDLYLLFIEKSLNLLREKGSMAFITSNKYMSQAYGLGIRKILLKNKINEIINLDYNAFETATVETAVLIVSKVSVQSNVIKILDIKRPINNLAVENRKLINQSFFDDTETKNFRINLDQDKINLIQKIRTGSIKVEDICYVTKGAEIHNTKEKLSKDEFIFDKKEQTYYKNYIEGKYFEKYIIKKVLYLNYCPNRHKAPIFPELFESNKLILKNVIGNLGLQVIYDNQKLYNNDALINCVPYCNLKNLDYSQIKNKITAEKIENSQKISLKYLLAVLNSKLMTWYFDELLGFGLHFYPNHLKQLPIKIVSSSEQKPIINLVDKIHAITFNNDVKNQSIVKSYENEVDKFVYKLYSLTPKEIKLVEGFEDK